MGRDPKGARAPLIVRAIRRLPPLAVRLLLAVDFALCILPPWAWFLMSRYEGRLVGLREFVGLYWRAVKFVKAHAGHTGQGTGALNVDWTSDPIRSCKRPENPGYEPQGSCGTCQNCCTTNWLPAAERQSCPFLASKGCRIYGGVYWDYFNCGRYPTTANAVSSYSCPRFEGIFAPGMPAVAAGESLPRPLPLAR